MLPGPSPSPSDATRRSAFSMARNVSWRTAFTYSFMFSSRRFPGKKTLGPDPFPVTRAALREPTLLSQHRRADTAVSPK